MCSLLRATLALSGVAIVLSHSPPFPRRKSLSFGPVHPHARFTTSPEPHLTAISSLAGASDPFQVARFFVEDLTRDFRQPEMSFNIRRDSYTDDRTGVSHVYIKQLVNGLQVADGDINLNIKDGRVISYGDSVRQNIVLAYSLF